MAWTRARTPPLPHTRTHTLHTQAWPASACPSQLGCSSLHGHPGCSVWPGPVAAGAGPGGLAAMEAAARHTPVLHTSHRRAATARSAKTVCTIHVGQKTVCITVAARAITQKKKIN